MLQVALSTVLLISAARLTQSLVASIRTPLGFDPKGVVALSYSFPWDTSKKKLDATYQATLDRFAAIPGVTSVGFVDRLPLQGASQSGQIEIPGRDLVPALRDLPVSRRSISDTYFATLGVPLIAGRMFTPRAKDVPECVVNSTFAHLFFPGEDAVGRKVTFDTKRSPGQEPRWTTITGVVADVRQEPGQSRAAAEVFFPFTNTFWPLANFVLRTNGDTTGVMAAARQQLQAVDPLLPIETLRPLSDELRRATSDVETVASLLCGFALTALLVAAIGLYGLLAAEVTSQNREIGIRLALGADPSLVLGNIIRRGLILVSVGLVLGLLLSYGAMELIANQLSGLTASPIGSGLLAAVIMLTIAFVASAIPAQRASRVDPAMALRHE